MVQYVTCRDNLIIDHKDEQCKWGRILISMNGAKLIWNLWATFIQTDAPQLLPIKVSEIALVHPVLTCMRQIDRCFIWPPNVHHLHVSNTSTPIIWSYSCSTMNHISASHFHPIFWVCSTQISFASISLMNRTTPSSICPGTGWLWLLQRLHCQPNFVLRLITNFSDELLFLFHQLIKRWYICTDNSNEKATAPLCCVKWDVFRLKMGKELIITEMRSVIQSERQIDLRIMHSILDILFNILNDVSSFWKLTYSAMLHFHYMVPDSSVAPGILEVVSITG